MEFEYVEGIFIDVARIAAFGIENQDVKIVLVGSATLMLHPRDVNTAVETIKAALTKRGAVFLA